jgi:hypothetical protein
MSLYFHIRHHGQVADVNSYPILIFPLKLSYLLAHTGTSWLGKSVKSKVQEVHALEPSA